MSWLLTMTLITAIIMAVAHAYLLWRYKKMSKSDIWVSTFPVLFILFLSFYSYPITGLGRYLLGSAAEMLKIFHPLNYWFWFGFVFSIHLFSWVLLIDILALFLSWVMKSNGEFIATIKRRVLGAAAIFLFIFTGFKMYHDTRDIQVDKVPVTVNNLPSSLDGLRIVHISDVHGDEFTGPRRVRRYIQKVNALQPDIIVFTGDLISYGTDFIKQTARAFSQANAKYGIYGVIGDHDYWAGALRVKAALEKYDIHILRDRNAYIPVHNNSLLLTGVTEVYSKHIPRDSLRLLTTHHKSVPLRILVSHQPAEDVIHQAQKAHYQLMLAGHTHGGQLRVPFLFMSFSAAEMDTKYLSGLFRIGNLLLNVNNGLGFTLAPVRYSAPPNISVIELRSK